MEMMCGSTRRSVSVVVFSPRASVKSSLSVENRSCTLLSYSNCKTQRHHERQRRDCLHLISTASGYVNLNIYCPPTKLQKGNIFSRNCPSVSHSVHGERSHVDITHDALDLTIQDPGPTPSSSPPHSSPEMVPNCTGPSPCPTTTSEIWWPRVEACLNLFT